MTQVVKVGESKDTTQPRLWGVLPWKMPDGMDAKKAQVIMRAFIEKTHRHDVLCWALKIPSGTAEMYLQNADTIPKSIAARLPVLKKILMKNPARTLRIMDKISVTDCGHGVSRSDETARVFKLETIAEINSNAAARAGFEFNKKRLERGMSRREVSELCERQMHVTISADSISDYEHRGITPSTKNFFTLCELYGVRPESFGFAGAHGEKIRKWRKETDDKPFVEASRAFGTAVKQARRERGLSLRDLEKQIGTQSSTISYIEIHGGTPGGKYFFKLCEALDLNPAGFGFTGLYGDAVDEWLKNTGRC